MQVREIQTGGHVVQSMKWNNQLIYRQKLPFDSYIYKAASNQYFSFPVTPYLDFSGLNPDNKESDSNIDFSYSNRMKWSSDHDMYYQTELQFKKIGAISGYIGSHLPYFKINLPPGQSLRITMGTEKYQGYGTNVSAWNYYIFYSEKLLAPSNLTKLIKYDGYISANTDCYVRDFENSGSLYQEYLSNNIIVPFNNGVATISNPTDDKKSFYVYFCINGWGNDSGNLGGYKNFGLGQITLERMVA